MRTKFIVSSLVLIGGLLIASLAQAQVSIWSDGEAFPDGTLQTTGMPGAYATTDGGPAGGWVFYATADDDGHPYVAGRAPNDDSSELNSSTGWWKPGINTLWQVQLSGAPLDTGVVADMFVFDYEDTAAATVDTLQGQSRRVVCHMSVGTWQDWRTDADAFPETVLGNNKDGWASEKWLDIRQIDVLGPILGARMDVCLAKGFDGIEPDNINGYEDLTGFPLTYQDQLSFNLWLANAAHTRGLSIGMKNNNAQVADLLAMFDWAMTEQCFSFNSCDQMQPFIAAGKPVFAIEYAETGITTDFCEDAVVMGFRAMIKNYDLDSWRDSCDGNTVYTTGDITVPAKVVTSGQSETYAATGQITTSGPLWVETDAVLNLRGTDIVIFPGLSIKQGALFAIRP